MEGKRDTLLKEDITIENEEISGSQEETLTIEEMREQKIMITYTYLFAGEEDAITDEELKMDFYNLQNLSLPVINKFMREFFFQINNSNFSEQGWKSFTGILREIEKELNDTLFEEKYGEINMIRDFTDQRLSFIIYVAIENRWGEYEFPRNELPNYWKLLEDEDNYIETGEKDETLREIENNEENGNKEQTVKEEEKIEVKVEEVKAVENNSYFEKCLIQ